MQFCWLPAIGIGAFLLGYAIYSRFISNRIYRLDPDFVRVLPNDVDGAFLQTRRRQEAAYLAEIENTFGSLSRYHLPLLAHDVRRLATLKEIGACLADSAASD